MISPAGSRVFAAVVDQLAVHGYALRRAWPRSLDHLHLDLQPLQTRPSDTQPSAVAGQWFADGDRARETATQTSGATQAGHFVWQPGGADRRLHSLAALLAEPGTELVGHRPERRAVLRIHDRADPITYAKVVPQRRWVSTMEATRRAERLPLRTPRLVGGDAAQGSVVTAALPGVPLHDLLTTDRAESACEATGEALAALHALPVPDDLPDHDLESEQAVTEHWEGLAAAFGVDFDAAPRLVLTQQLTPDPSTRPPPLTPRPRVVLHRDLHDKQVLVDDDGGVGMLDFDLMALGDPALDLANLLVHLDLRSSQGVAADAPALREAVLRGYGPTPEVLSAITSYEALAVRRIAAVYAFRNTTYVT